MKVRQLAPVWQENYDVGYVGFTFHDDEALSWGIAYFEQFEGYELIPVSHALIVSGPGRCIEAQGGGVVEADLTARFNDPHCRVFFRKPIGYSQDLGQRIVASAAKHIGEPYNWKLIKAHALDHTMLGRLVNGLTGDVLERELTKLADSDHTQICSKLAALALNDQPELQGRGVLARPAREILPKMLFADGSIFEDWYGQVSHPQAVPAA